MGKDENKTVFIDTENICKTNHRIKESVQNSIKQQKLILESEELQKPNLERYAEEAKILVSKKRTFEAAKTYKDQKVAVHNFASASNPGGGVTSGANAQEECLCRCSSLYFCLNIDVMWKGFYNPHRESHNPIHNDDVIYTPGVTVFKSDTSMPKLMPENDWFDVDVITCAAPNLRIRPTNKFNPADGDAVKMKDKDLLLLHEKKLRRMLNIAVIEGVETIILGAFDCGAFCK